MQNQASRGTPQDGTRGIGVRLGSLPVEKYPPPQPQPLKAAVGSQRAKNAGPLFKLRPLCDADWHFVLDSWLRSFRHGNDHARAADMRPFFTQEQDGIERARERGAVFSIACADYDEEQIFGWACYEEMLLHYVYVKQPYRQTGIATALLGGASAWFCTHWTKMAQKISEQYEQLKRIDF